MNGFYAFLAVVVIVGGILLGINMYQKNEPSPKETNLNITVPQSSPQPPQETPAAQMPAASAPTTQTDNQ